MVPCPLLVKLLCRLSLWLPGHNVLRVRVLLVRPELLHTVKDIQCALGNRSAGSRGLVLLRGCVPRQRQGKVGLEFRCVPAARPVQGGLHRDFPNVLEAVAGDDPAARGKRQLAASDPVRLGQQVFLRLSQVSLFMPANLPRGAAGHSLRNVLLKASESCILCARERADPVAARFRPSL
jgi:hypothetical protein